MKKWICIPLCLVLILAIYGATQGKPAHSTKQNYALYFASSNLSDNSALDTETRVFSSDEDISNQLIQALLDGPTRSDLTSVFPKGTTLLSQSQEKGILTLNFSKEYSDLTGAKLTLANGAVVLTMTQLKTVDSVRLLSAGEPVLPGTTVQALSADDFDLSGMSADPILLKTVLYFPSKDGKRVIEETRALQTSASQGAGEIQAVLNALCAGPEHKNAVSYLPSSAEDVTIRLKKNTCLLTLPDQWLRALLDEEGTATLAAWALSASLTELDNVEQVSYWDNGAEIPALSAEKIAQLYDS